MILNNQLRIEFTQSLETGYGMTKLVFMDNKLPFKIIKI